ncbi:hypothetical protein MXD61_01675 [Frankia sp. AgPm24]|uniref:hypothetical protein n=1 Tax=Frankia sp. AgPm24 TaxID=631128 RepID=UPI00200FC42E|nr:hypothetical protein [Frankia sp. AgPm24]MCK9920629.1 hypothetical protein [Frankia sp. AgPm24]
MSEDTPPEHEAAGSETSEGPTGPPPQVRALFPTCPRCRRERARTLRAARTGAAARRGLPRLTLHRPVLRCPHIPDVWAPGFGPGAEPPSGSGWPTRPAGPA